ncbi:TPA: rhomboid family intramembrane serine protease [Staphylococcus aureus]|nr:rhomboid family intramembrane serine protease [Staphylococcus aureus]
MFKNKINGVHRYFSSLDTVTKTILVINVIAYLFLVIQYGFDAIFGLNVEQLLEIGGVTGNSPLVTTLFSMFLHYSIFHFLINMVILVLLSRTINDHFSQMTYFIVYLLSGIIGNLVSQDFTPKVVSIGASGGIYGLVGLLLISAIFKKKYPQLNDMFMFIFVTAIIFVVGTFFSEISNVTAHIIGLVIGGGSALLIQNFKLEVYKETEDENNVS